MFVRTYQHETPKRVFSPSRQHPSFILLFYSQWFSTTSEYYTVAPERRSGPDICRDATQTVTASGPLTLFSVGDRLLGRRYIDAQYTHTRLAASRTHSTHTCSQTHVYTYTENDPHVYVCKVLKHSRWNRAQMVHFSPLFLYKTIAEVDHFC